MNDDPSNESSKGIPLEDIYYVLFRHKKKIIFSCMIGAMAAAAFWVVKAPPWQSESKLLIHYVTEARTPSATGSEANVKSPDERGENIINTEVQILTSLDLARQVAESVGTEKILAKTGGTNDQDEAATLIRKNLTVEAPQRSSVIRIVFKHPNPEVVQPVLKSVVDNYFKTHLEIHRAGGILGNFLTQETDQLHSQLAQLERDLGTARNKAGVISLEEAKKTASEQISRLRQEIFEAEANLAEHQAAIENLTQAKAKLGTGRNTNGMRETSPGDAQNYRDVCTRLNVLWAKEGELLSQFTEETSMVKDVRYQIAEMEKLKKKLEDENPNLAVFGTVAPPQSTQPIEPMENLATEATRAASLASRIKVLNTQLNQIRAEASSVDKMEPEIQELERKKELVDSHYRNLSSSLEQYHIDDALGAGKALNISKIQAPSPPFRELDKQFKIMVLLVAGGLFGGIGWAFVIDRYFDHSVKRPKDFEIRFGQPLFLSIPKMTSQSCRQLAEKSGEMASQDQALAPTGSKTSPDNHQSGMRPYFEALGARLVANLQARDVSHKPKLVAVTGAGKGTGVTTIAVGLAACLSEIGNGNVLLVDMNAAQESIQKFYKGEPGCGLEVALKRESRNEALVQNNLYVATANSTNNNLQSLLPKQFTSLMPKLRASDFDYIVFDMPPVSQTSITPRLAGLMDLVVFTVEAEKTSLEVVQQAKFLLEQSGAEVGFVLNQTQSYIPAALNRNTLNDF